MFREKLASAIDRKNNDINSFIWKGRKQEVNGALVQEEKRLVDCTEEELRGFYAHCDSMLYNTNKDYPGRYVLLDIIKELCAAVLKSLETFQQRQYAKVVWTDWESSTNNTLLLHLFSSKVYGSLLKRART